MHITKAFRESLLEFIKDVRTSVPRLAEDAFKYEMALTAKKCGRKKGFRFKRPLDLDKETKKLLDIPT